MISHLFFLTAFFGLLAAALLVLIRHRREWRPMVLVLLPLALIFVTAYLGKNAPAAHQVMNLFYDGLLLYNTYYFWGVPPRLIFWLYVFVLVSTVLDFAMHFVIRAM